MDELSHDLEMAFGQPLLLATVSSPDDRADDE